MLFNPTSMPDWNMKKAALSKVSKGMAKLHMDHADLKESKGVKGPMGKEMKAVKSKKKK